MLYIILLILNFTDIKNTLLRLKLLLFLQFDHLFSYNNEILMILRIKFAIKLIKIDIMIFFPSTLALIHFVS